MRSRQPAGSATTIARDHFPTIVEQDRRVRFPAAIAIDPDHGEDPCSAVGGSAYGGLNRSGYPRTAITYRGLLDQGKADTHRSSRPDGEGRHPPFISP
jgi:hypothetical protein